jgi:hypothetical protein
MNYRVSAFFLVSLTVFAQRFVISTFAGGPPGAKTPVPAYNVDFSWAQSVAADVSGTLIPVSHSRQVLPLLSIRRSRLR